MTRFAGFPEAALDFYDDLETENTRSFWAAHKDVYETSVKAPMVALVAALEPEFGTGKVFRPYRDVRYAKDKTPYKTHQGAFVERGASAGWYVQVDPRGVMVEVGFYHAASEQLGRFRDAVADDRVGGELEQLLAELTGSGWVLKGDRLKTTPRGYDAAHRRIGLLRHKTLSVTKSYGFEPVIHTAALLDLVRADWHAGRPLIEWLAGNGVS
ncbi:MAG: DUF2461 domain-containing protein [Propionibacteriales bacterium]|nr:DUF2461 domain-containing protein [Propionibacteriales bacterium]